MTMNQHTRLFRPYFRGLPIIVLCMFIGFWVAKKYLSYVTPKYQSTAKIKLAERSEGVPNSKLFKDFDVFVSTNNIQAEIELMKSAVLVGRAIEDLNLRMVIYRVGEIKKQELYKNAPFHIAAIDLENYVDVDFELNITGKDSFTLRCLEQNIDTSGRFGDTIELSRGKLIVNLLNEIAFSTDFDLIDDYAFTYFSAQHMLDLITTSLDIYPADKDVPVVSITCRSVRPQKAADLANALARIYIDDYVSSRYHAAQSTVNFLDDRIEKVSQDLTLSESAIERYKSRKGVVNLRQESETDLRKISQLKIQLSNLKISLEAIDQLESSLKFNRDDFLRLAPNFQAHTDLLSTELLKKIKSFQAEKRDLLITFTVNDERVKVIDAKIQDLADYLLEAVSNTRRDLNTKYYELRNEIAIAEDVFIGFSRKEKDLTVLNRTFGIFENSYTFLNEKLLEAEIAKAAKISLHRIIADAYPPSKPTSPNTTIILIVAVLLGMLGAMACIFFVHSVKGKVNDETTIEERSSIPVVLRTPLLKNQAVIEDHFSKEAIQLDLKGLVGIGERIVITSCGGDEGGRFHCKELAKAFVKQDKSVLVFNCTSRKLNLGDIPVIDLQNGAYSHMGKSKFRKRISKLSKGYDLVLINNEGMLEEHLGLLTMSAADQNLFVLDSRRTPVSCVDEIELIQEEYDFHNLHFVINRHQYLPNILRGTLDCCIGIIKHLKPKSYELV